MYSITIFHTYYNLNRDKGIYYYHYFKSRHTDCYFLSFGIQKQNILNKSLQFKHQIPSSIWRLMLKFITLCVYSYSCHKLSTLENVLIHLLRLPDDDVAELKKIHINLTKGQKGLHMHCHHRESRIDRLLFFTWIFLIKKKFFVIKSTFQILSTQTIEKLELKLINKNPFAYSFQ